MTFHRFTAALTHAVELHDGHYRKGTEVPYVSHLLAVTALALEHGADEDEAIAALLHDGPEDQGGEATLVEIRDRFGDRVADIVAECSDTFETRKPPWRHRKEAYLRHLRDEASASTLLVSACDKLHNLRSILRDYRVHGEDLWSRFNAAAEPAETREAELWYYRSLHRVYEDRASDEPRIAPLVEEIGRTLDALEELIARSFDAVDGGA